MSHKDEAENLISRIETTISALQTEAAKAQALADKERNLEVWRQAYNAALGCYGVTRVQAMELADSALDHYLAKREELMK